MLRLNSIRRIIHNSSCNRNVISGDANASDSGCVCVHVPRSSVRLQQDTALVAVEQTWREGKGSFPKGFLCVTSDRHDVTISASINRSVAGVGAVADQQFPML